jgi:hypothetical protein
MGLFNRLERALGRYAIPNLSLYLVMGQVFVFLLAILGRDLSGLLALQGARVYNGEIWRLFTFVVVPPLFTNSALPLIFIVFGWYLFYLMGGALEQFWGVFRYNCFLLVGWILTVPVAFLFPTAWADTIFIGGCVFLAFAYLNPNFELLLFFILPVKIKWLALLMWLRFGYIFIIGDKADRFMILAALGNFIIFFAGDIVQRVKGGKRRMAYQAKQAAARDNDEPRHRCVVCGKTDQTHPLEDFRYADDDRCYCSEHRPGAAKSA